MDNSVGGCGYTFVYRHWCIWVGVLLLDGGRVDVDQQTNTQTTFENNWGNSVENVSWLAIARIQPGGERP